jgi:hypothetical protein
MTFSRISTASCAPRNRRVAFLFMAAAAAITAASTHASPFKQTDSALPIQAADNISNPRAFETSRRLIVAGSVNPALRSPSAHVDVQLVGSSGQILAEKVDRLTWPHPRTGGGRHGNCSFTGGFPLDVARQAARIVVSFKSGPHSKCGPHSNS